jgi:nucleoid-associated protein YgaU
MRLSAYASVLCQRFVPGGFDDQKVTSFFKKYPNRPGELKLTLVQAPLTDEQLDKYGELMEDQLKQRMRVALKNVNIPYTPERINELLLLVKQSDILATNDQEILDLDSLLVDKARAMTIAIAEDAAKVFRNHPSSENYFKWLATNKMIDVIGADLPDNFAPPFKLMYNKPYTVISGDTLSKIALKYYGHENLWDIIWDASGMNFHPDQIIPGQKLILP